MQYRELGDILHIFPSLESFKSLDIRLIAKRVFNDFVVSEKLETKTSRKFVSQWG